MLVSRANSYYENRIHVILLIPLLFTFKNRKLTYMKYVYRLDDAKISSVYFINIVTLKL